MNIDKFSFPHLTAEFSDSCDAERDRHNDLRARSRSGMNKSGWFLADGDPIEVLKRLTLRHQYSVVVSREDAAPNFFTHVRSSEYITHLQENPTIVQTRFKIYDANRQEPLRDKELEVHNRFKNLHRLHGKFYTVPGNVILEPNFDLLRQALYGLTIFLDKEFSPSAIPQFLAIPTPPLTFNDLGVHHSNPLDLLDSSVEYSPSGPMQMMLIYETALVRQVFQQVVALLRNESTAPM